MLSRETGDGGYGASEECVESRAGLFCGLDVRCVLIEEEDGRETIEVRGCDEIFVRDSKVRRLEK